jgi:glycosyltransferase involved in cell wall biosynthesis
MCNRDSPPYLREGFDARQESAQTDASPHIARELKCHSGDRISIGFLVGVSSWAHCGVSDYVVRLAEALTLLGVNAEIIDSKKTPKARDLARFDILHHQYPSAAEGYSIRSVFRTCRPSMTSFLTVHEFSRAHPLRKIFIAGLMTRTRNVVTTTRDEQMALRRVARAKLPISIIPIASNIVIPQMNIAAPIEKRIAYFGLIRPRQGLEAFLELSHRLCQEQGWTSVVIGAIADGAEAYAESLRSGSSSSTVWTGRLSPTDAAHELAMSWCAYLPFPDGASARRASLLAAVQNGVPVLTTYGSSTEEELANAVITISSADDAYMAAVSMTLPKREEISDRGSRYASRFSWCAIAEGHLAAYKLAIARKD